MKGSRKASNKAGRAVSWEQGRRREHGQEGTGVGLPAQSKRVKSLHPDVRLPQNGPQGSPVQFPMCGDSSAATTCCPETRGNLLILPTTALPACPLARAGRLPARQQCNLQSPPECSGWIPHAWRLGRRNRADSGTPLPSSRPRRDESEPVACLKGMNAPAICQVVPVTIAGEQVSHY